MPFICDSFGKKRGWTTSKIQFWPMQAQDRFFFFFSCEIHEMAKQTVSVKYNNTGKQEIFLLLDKACLVQQPDSLDLTYSIPLVNTT